MKRHLTAAAMACCAATPLFAQEAGQASVGLGISTLGAVLEGRYRATETFGLRAFYAGLPNLSGTLDVDGTDYDVDGTLGGFSLMADVFPMGGGLRLSGGVFVSNSSLDANATASPSNPIVVGSTSYTSGEQVNATANFKNEITPIATIGYVRTRGNWQFSAEAGGIFTNGFDVNVTGSGLPASDLNSEADDIRNDLNKIKVYPYVSLMAAYRF